MKVEELDRSEICTQVKYAWNEKVFELDTCPDWAQWAAVDKDGNAFWYNNEPDLCSFGWLTSLKDKCKSICDADKRPLLFKTDNWVYSLIKRPKPAHKNVSVHLCRDSKGRFVSKIKDATPDLPQTQCLPAEAHYNYGRCKLLEFAAREISDEYGNAMMQLRLLLKNKRGIVELVIDVHPVSKEKGALRYFVLQSGLEYALFSALLQKDKEIDADLSAICPVLYIYSNTDIREIRFPAASCWRIEREIAL
jgi:hypothetical protein